MNSMQVEQVGVIVNLGVLDLKTLDTIGNRRLLGHLVAADLPVKTHCSW